MPRRRREGFFDTLVQLPWPAGVVTGVVGFAAIRWGLAAVMRTGGPIGENMAKVADSGALSPWAWIFLVICWIAAAVSYWRSGDRIKLLNAQKNLDSIRALSWQQIEQLVGEAYRRRGYRVEETGQGGADGGIDVLLTRDGATTLVQCKHWRSRQVGVSVVREMFGLMQHHHAAEGKIVCTGVFSADCFRFAVGKPIELIDGDGLYRLVADVRKYLVRNPVAPPAVPPPPVAPPCPTCNTTMVERTNRSNAKRFWGCPRYPACRGTLEF
jgi:restriction system protein